MVKIKKDGKEVEIELKKTKVKHKKIYYKALAEMQKDPIKGTIAYYEKMHAMVLELTEGITEKDLDNLDNEEMDKMVGEIVSSFTLFGSKGFLSSSSKSPEQKKQTQD